MKKIALIAVALLLVSAPLFATPPAPTDLGTNVNLTIESYASMAFGGDINITVSNGHSTGSASTGFTVDTNYNAHLAASFGGSLPGSWLADFFLNGNGGGTAIGENSVNIGNDHWNGYITATVYTLSMQNAANNYSGTLTVTLSAI